MTFSPGMFEKLKGHLQPGTMGLGFSLRPDIDISISDNTAYGRGWELRIHEKSNQLMLILTQKEGQLTPEYCRLSPHPSGSGYLFNPAGDPEFEARAAQLYVETVEHLERRRAEAEEANRQAIARLRAFSEDGAAMERWRELIFALVPDERAEKIQKATAKSFGAPEGFVKRLRSPPVTPDLPWLLLVHTLKKEKLLFEFDWRQDPQKEAARRGLPGPGRILVVLDTGGDSFPTSQIAEDRFERAVELAASFGWRIHRSFK